MNSNSSPFCFNAAVKLPTFYKPGAWLRVFFLKEKRKALLILKNGNACNQNLFGSRIPGLGKGKQ